MQQDPPRKNKQIITFKKPHINSLTYLIILIKILNKNRFNIKPNSNNIQKTIFQQLAPRIIMHKNDQIQIIARIINPIYLTKTSLLINKKLINLYKKI
jgi:hypothetical protein